MDDWDQNDRRGWRYTIGGRPGDVAQLFVDRLCGLARVNISMICSRRSLAAWEHYFPHGAGNISRSVAFVPAKFDEAIDTAAPSSQTRRDGRPSAVLYAPATTPA